MARHGLAGEDDPIHVYVACSCFPMQLTTFMPAPVDSLNFGGTAILECLLSSTVAQFPPIAQPSYPVPQPTPKFKGFGTQLLKTTSQGDQNGPKTGNKGLKPGLASAHYYNCHMTGWTKWESANNGLGAVVRNLGHLRSVLGT